MKINELIELTWNNPQNIDLIKFITTHVQSDDYDPYHDDEILRNELNSALKEKNHQKIIQQCYDILKWNPFDIESHIIITQASLEMNKQKLYQLHNYLASSLIDSILFSGTGLSLESPYVIHYPQDEIAIFTFNKKYPTERIQHEKDGRFFDIYKFKDDSSLYFDITIPFTHISGEI